jgi:choline dehydrogenase
VETFAYIVAGGGSAGCAVTTRLVEAGKSVLMIESGPSDNHPFIHIPATFIKVHGTERTWMYKTDPEEHLHGRRAYIPQGRTLGGGSSVNALGSRVRAMIDMKCVCSCMLSKNRRNRRFTSGL